MTGVGKRLHNRSDAPAVTIRDVARLAEVHPGTVSRALNEQTRALVNQETAERVLRAAEELGYRPNPIARGLKTNRSYTVGVLIPDLTNPLFPPIMRGIEDRLGEAGYTLLIVNTDNDPERERSHMEAMRARQVDGFIAATARLDVELLAEVAGRRDARWCSSTAASRTARCPAVTVDDRQGIALAVDHVVGLGHRRIGHVAGPQNVSTGHRRYLGFLEAMGAAGLERVPASGSASRDAFTEAEGARACDRAARARAAADRDRRRQRPAGDRLLRRARGARAPLPGGRLDRRLQRHAVRRPSAPAADAPCGCRSARSARWPRTCCSSSLVDGTQPAREILLEPTLVVRGSTAPAPEAG